MNVWMLLGVMGCRNDPTACWWCETDTTPPLTPTAEHDDEWFEEEEYIWTVEHMREDGETTEAWIWHFEGSEENQRCELFVELTLPTPTDCEPCDWSWSASIALIEADGDCSEAREQLDALPDPLSVGGSADSGWLHRSGEWVPIGEPVEEVEGSTVIEGFYVEGELIE